MNRVPVTEAASVFECLVMHAADNPQAQKQGLYIAGQLMRGSCVIRGEVSGIGKEAVPRPQTSEEKLQIAIAKGKDFGGNEFLRRLFANDAQGVCPSERARSRGRIWLMIIGCHRCAAALALPKPRIASGGKAHFLAVLSRPAVHARHRLRKLSGRLGKILHENRIVTKEIQARGMAGIAF